MDIQRTDIAKAISKDLLYNDALDVNNFGDDTDAILDYVQKVILEHIKDYLIISGTLL